MTSALTELGDALPYVKGLMFAVAFIPEESLLLLYGRNKPFMTTKFRRADSPSERNSLLPAVRAMHESLAENKWKLSGFRVLFYYDRRIALKGKIAKK
jgi:hypothetical protein